MSGIIQQELASRGVAQVLVFLRDSGPQTAAAAAAEQTTATSRLSKHFVESASSQAGELRATRRARARGGDASAVRFYPRLGVMLGTATREGIAALRADERVADVAGAPSISLIRPTAKASAKLAQTTTWGLDALNVPKLWKQGLDGRGVVVGHLDTGVDGKHPALREAIQSFAEFDELGREVTPAPEPFDSDDHGTHTAATIAARAVQGRHVGVAPAAKLASAVVIEGGEVVARVLGGMEWSLGQGARVLNMSLGFRGWWEDFVVLTRVLRARGVLPVFAVGNEGPGTSRSPGNYAEAVSVGAHDESWRVADFSSSQRFQRKQDALVPDLVAPGVDVISAAPGGGYQSMNGSSMATPHVAGLAALLMQAAPKATVAQIERAILRSCRRPATMPQSRSNRGAPDAVRALAELGV